MASSCTGDTLCGRSHRASPEFRLDKAELFVPMIAELKIVQPEFVSSCLRPSQIFVWARLLQSLAKGRLK
jgi:hypothetical protein